MGSVIENPEYITVSRPENANIIDVSRLTSPNVNNALVILNQKISIPIIDSLWRSYALKVCADGGANRLYDHFSDEHTREQFIPQFIVGDLDSLRPEVGAWYVARGTRLIKQETQYATDLGKALQLIEIYYNNPEFDNMEIDTYDSLASIHLKLSSNTEKIQILLIGGIDGRFDHTIQSISVLLKHSAGKITLNYLSNTDLILCVPKGLNFIDYSSNTSMFHGANCGLLPLAGKVTLRTSGLKWDVCDWESEVSGAVSSSNRFVGDQGAIIESSGDFVMSIEFEFDKLK
jgi:thiamine pyrophosphokinase